MAEEPMTVISIKNMVCPRCELVVRDALEELGLTVAEVQLGKATVAYSSKVSKKEINEALKQYGFELLEGKDQKLVEQIKRELIYYVQQIEDENDVPKLSDYLAKQLNQNYASLSSAFSESEDITIEKYMIHLKIERVRELLSYGEMTLSEIAHKLNYSSVAHLSNQFKQIIGMSVTDFKKVRETFRRSLDRI